MATNFKIKHNRAKNVIEINTLDETHKKIMTSFQNRRELLPKKKEKIQYLRNQLSRIENLDGSNYTTEDIKKRADLKIRISNLETEINDIENNLSELDYYFKTEDIIMDYYEIVDNDDNILYHNHPELSEAKIFEESKNESGEDVDKLDMLNLMNRDKKKIRRPTKRRKKGFINDGKADILSFFSTSPDSQLQPKNNDVNGNNTEVTETENYNSEMEDDNYLGETTECCDTTKSEAVNSDSPINQTKKNKSELLDQYMMFVNSDYVSDQIKINEVIRYCLKCGIEKTLIHSESIYVCQKCGEVETVIIDSEKPNYKEAVIDTKPGYIWVAIKVDMKSILLVQ